MKTASKKKLTPRRAVKATRKANLGTRSARRVAVRRGPKAYRTGGALSRKSRVHLRDVVLKMAEGLGPKEAAEKLGLRAFDIDNLRNGNGVSTATLLRLVCVGRFDPDSLLWTDKPRKLPTSVSTENCSMEELGQRIAVLSRSAPARELASRTGLAPITIYHHRVVKKTPGIDLVLGFIHAGVPARQLLLGKSSRKSAGRAREPQKRARAN